MYPFRILHLIRWTTVIQKSETVLYCSGNRTGNNQYKFFQLTESSAPWSPSHLHLSHHSSHWKIFLRLLLYPEYTFLTGCVTLTSIDFFSSSLKTTGEEIGAQAPCRVFLLPKLEINDKPRQQGTERLRICPQTFNYEGPASGLKLKRHAPSDIQSEKAQPLVKIIIQ